MKVAIRLQAVPATISNGGIHTIIASKDTLYIKVRLQETKELNEEMDEVTVAASKQLPINVFFEDVNDQFINQYKNNIKVCVDGKEMEARYDTIDTLEECQPDDEMDCLFSTENLVNKKFQFSEDEAELNLEIKIPAADEIKPVLTMPAELSGVSKLTIGGDAITKEADVNQDNTVQVEKVENTETIVATQEALATITVPEKDINEVLQISPAVPANDNVYSLQVAHITVENTAPAPLIPDNSEMFETKNAAVEPTAQVISTTNTQQPKAKTKSSVKDEEFSSSPFTHFKVPALSDFTRQNLLFGGGVFVGLLGLALLAKNSGGPQNNGMKM